MGPAQGFNVAVLHVLPASIMPRPHGLGAQKQKQARAAPMAAPNPPRVLPTKTAR